MVTVRDGLLVVLALVNAAPFELLKVATPLFVNVRLPLVNEPLYHTAFAEADVLLIERVP